MNSLFFIVLFSVQPVDFNADIKPILEENCNKCHGEDKQKSDFRIDRKSSLLKGGDLGEPAVVPGHPEKSTLLKFISLPKGDDEIMPPKGDPLSKKQIQLIERWVKEGASMPEDKVVEEETLWSYKPVKNIPIPKNTESHPIDAFLAESLKAKEMTFSKQAEPIPLLRRLQAILTGLYPSPSEAAAFLKQWEINSTKAYKEKVNELIASPQFGERWATHWLDAIRWSETNGSESNEYRRYAWQYRDYVIRAFNEDKPYVEFIMDQLCGDITGEPRATGFLVSGPHVPAQTIGNQESAIKQARYDRLDQVLQTIGSSMMGMTLNCARCHSHKFDPIKINDYYSILANFQSVEFGLRQPELSKDDPLAKEYNQLREELKKERQKINDPLWVERWDVTQEVHFKETKTEAIRLTFMKKHVVIDELEIYNKDGIDVMENAKLSTNMTGVKSQLKRLRDDLWGGFYKFRGTNPKEKSSLTIEFKKKERLSNLVFSSNRRERRITDYIVIANTNKVNTGGFKIEVKTDEGQWETLTDNIMKNFIPYKGALQQLVNEILKRGPQYEFIGQFIKTEKTHVLKRGNPMSPGAEVVPGAIPGLGNTLHMSSHTPDKTRRESFAKWIASEKNPLTARVMVNRLWHHVFGSGLVTTLSDFGNAGAKPSHPELLDWLADDFVKEKWSMKTMIKKMVMTRAFRQSSLPNGVYQNIDSNARTLWRYPPRRVEAEVIRDSILKLSSSLKNKMGGVGYRIHNVKKKYDLWKVVDNHSEKTWRRMIYQERMRGIDDRMFTAFDFPDCSQLLSKRPSSTTPLQALNLMNSQFIERQCRILADKYQGEKTAVAVKQAFLKVYNRMPSQTELTVCVDMVKQSGLQSLYRVLLNSNEFVFIQ